jgi:hypothetical protein
MYLGATESGAVLQLACEHSGLQGLISGSPQEQKGSRRTFPASNSIIFPTVIRDGKP